mgnify:CR=1 FL=1
MLRSGRNAKAFLPRGDGGGRGGAGNELLPVLEALETEGFQGARDAAVAEALICPEGKAWPALAYRQAGVSKERSDATVVKTVAASAKWQNL